MPFSNTLPHDFGSKRPDAQTSTKDTTDCTPATTATIRSAGQGYGRLGRARFDEIGGRRGLATTRPFTYESPLLTSNGWKIHGAEYAIGCCARE